MRIYVAIDAELVAFCFRVFMTAAAVATVALVFIR
jgi:hypothetical protein